MSTPPRSQRGRQDWFSPSKPTRSNDNDAQNNNRAQPGAHRQASRPQSRPRSKAGTKIDLPSYLGNRQDISKSGPSIRKARPPMQRTPNDPDAIRKQKDFMNCKNDISIEIIDLLNLMESWKLNVRVHVVQLAENIGYISNDHDADARKAMSLQIERDLDYTSINGNIIEYRLLKALGFLAGPDVGKPEG